MDRTRASCCALQMQNHPSIEPFTKPEFITQILTFYDQSAKNGKQKRFVDSANRTITIQLYLYTGKASNESAANRTNTRRYLIECIYRSDRDLAGKSFPHTNITWSSQNIELDVEPHAKCGIPSETSAHRVLNYYNAFSRHATPIRQQSTDFNQDKSTWRCRSEISAVRGGGGWASPARTYIQFRDEIVRPHTAPDCERWSVCGGSVFPADDGRESISSY